MLFEIDGRRFYRSSFLTLQKRYYFRLSATATDGEYAEYRKVRNGGQPRTSTPSDSREKMWKLDATMVAQNFLDGQINL